MPGAPTGRGCEACRKQKKKCDQQQPSCARCKRLRIPCIGSGTKRYKWNIETTNRSHSRVSVSPGADQSRSPSSSSVSVSDRALSRQISRSPSNTQTVLASTLIDKAHLTVNSDLRYNLTWAYGTFIQEVPRRLGNNAALDAAATSLALSHVRFSMGRRDVTPVEITAYVDALSVLRKCLDDPVIAQDTNTLCAIMILLMVQQFVGANGNKTTGHGEGAAIVLKAKGVAYKPNDEFENILLSTLRGPLLFEGLLNPKIKFTDEEWASLITDHMTKGTPSEVNRMVASWVHLPRLTEAARQAWKSTSKISTDDFKDALKDSYELYETQLQLLDSWRSGYRLSSEDVSNATDEKSTTKAKYIYALNQRMYSMALFNVSYINCLIRAMLPSGSGLPLRKEAVGFGQEVIGLSKEAMVFRPLGSAFMPLCLMVAWFTPEDGDMRAEIEALWNIYVSDYPSSRDMKLERNLDSCGFLGELRI